MPDQEMALSWESGSWRKTFTQMKKYIIFSAFTYTAIEDESEKLVQRCA